MLRAGLFFAFFSHVLVSLFWLTGSKSEIFPVFNWNLYSAGSPSYRDYSIEVLELDGKPMNCVLDNCISKMNLEKYRHPFYFAVQEFGRDSEGSEALKNMLLSRAESAKVKLLHREYEPFRLYLYDEYVVLNEKTYELSQ